MARKIYFVCPYNPNPLGGVKQIYRMVDILNENGFEAFILHKKNQRHSWFKNNTKILAHPYLFKQLIRLEKPNNNFLKKIKLAVLKKNSYQFEDDAILVFPEVYSTVQSIEPNIQKVIFNQNCYYTFNRFSYDDNLSQLPYFNDSVLAAIVVSEDSQQYLKLTFPEKKTYRTRIGIDSNIFHFHEKKKKQIAFMPRKLKKDVEQIISILKIRNKISDWEFIEIDNKSENEVAQTLKESTIFISFNNKEGFGLPPVEAMACGCVVVGYEGGGGKEYFKKEFSFPIEEGNIIEYVKKIEEVVNHYSDEELFHIGKKASEFVLNNYNLENEKKDIISIWKDILSNQRINDFNK